MKLKFSTHPPISHFQVIFYHLKEKLNFQYTLRSVKISHFQVKIFSVASCMLWATLHTRLKSRYFIPFFRFRIQYFFYHFKKFFTNKTHFYRIIQEILRFLHSTFLSKFSTIKPMRVQNDTLLGKRGGAYRTSSNDVWGIELFVLLIPYLNLGSSSASTSDHLYGTRFFLYAELIFQLSKNS